MYEATIISRLETARKIESESEAYTVRVTNDRVQRKLFIKSAVLNGFDARVPDLPRWFI